ncbi:MAG: FMN-binding negative transcriptional regulator [Rhodoferax sp.]|nr:FMN-binding negative transcriptional regulator [Rhodoferax sp.]
MYLPAHFSQTDLAPLHALMRQYPLATLVTEANGGPVADELPFVLDAELGPHCTLKAHVARANPLWQVHPAQRRVLVVFRGPQAYVSPSWYPGKAEHGRVVPTWNYTLVQASGLLRVVDGDALWLRAQLDALTHLQEAARPQPWSLADAPADYVARMMSAVVGLEITLTGLSAKFKLSQNHPLASRQAVAQGLAGEPFEAARQVAGLMA